jgi:hypothetical protein
VVGFDPTNVALSNGLALRIGLPAGVPLFGPFAGKLDNSRDSVELARPDAPGLIPFTGSDSVPFVLADKVKYSQNLPWPAAADGLGPSLQRMNESAYGNDPANWQAATLTPGSSYVSGPLPAIVRQPQSQTNVVSFDVTLDMQAECPSPLHYQWLFNGAYLPGATQARLVLTNVQPAQAGRYVVVVWSDAGSVSSQPAVLALQIPAAILIQPTNVLVRIKPDSLASPTTNAVFRVTASSSSPLRYQWWFNGAELPGATNATLTILDVQAADWGEYVCAITDDVATVLSAPAWLYPLVKPAFVQVPLSQSVVVKSPVTLSAEISGWPPPFTFEWRLGSNPQTTVTQQASVSYFTFLAANSVTIQTYRLVVKNAAAPPTGVVSPNTLVSTLADNDGDGLADVWESVYGFPTNSVADPLADTDGDGVGDGQEYVAGTDPLDRSSYLRIEAVATNGIAAVLFGAVSNRTYTVQSADDLELGRWSKLADVLARASNHVEYLPDPGFSTNRFYRVVTPRQP